VALSGVDTEFGDRPIRNARRMHSIEEVHLVRSLLEEGLNDCEISRRTGIPRGTVRDWRHGKIPRAVSSSAAELSCKQCGHPAHEFSSLAQLGYVYLLGLYLGDGFIAKHPRTYRLTIFMDRAYPRIAAECGEAMRRVMPTSKVGVLRRPNEQLDEIYSYSKAWPCLYPQHGPGMKHLRRIELTDWQRQLVKADPRPLLRGLIQSDGSRHINTIRHPKKTYKYPRYEFTNRSADIKGIFCSACDLLGIDWRVMNAKTISIARRESVALMDQFVGPKQ
jgi:hypothetical protein